MEQLQEHVHEFDYFGFDPAPPTTKDQKKENSSSIYDPGTREVRNLSYAVATQLSVEEVEPHNVSKSNSYRGNTSDNSYNLPDKDNTGITSDFWGFDPHPNSSQRSIASSRIRPQHNHDNQAPLRGEGSL
ncbi:hypothetical protein AnigIFM63604_003964 [Aspergillus niger]|uniref:Uncharacterized protein n=1 Tax=Aspergillus niger TaxID=5061 RepID=A0A9W6A967_ASPNG|nr:hypothetical protein AnigIFM63604_003964 [Aspergillus niger]